MLHQQLGIIFVIVLVAKSKKVCTNPGWLRLTHNRGTRWSRVATVHLRITIRKLLHDDTALLLIRGDQSRKRSYSDHWRSGEGYPETSPATLRSARGQRALYYRRPLHHKITGIAKDAATYHICYCSSSQIQENVYKPWLAVVDT